MRRLSATDATALFMRLAGRSRLRKQSVGEFVAVCGYLPLAVALLAARLRHHPSWSVDDLKDRLLSPQHRLVEMQAGERAVAAAFDLSYQDLPVNVSGSSADSAGSPGSTSMKRPRRRWLRFPAGGAVRARGAVRGSPAG